MHECLVRGEPNTRYSGKTAFLEQQGSSYVDCGRSDRLVLASIYFVLLAALVLPLAIASSCIECGNSLLPRDPKIHDLARAMSRR
jgi:hypothetical protein